METSKSSDEWRVSRENVIHHKCVCGLEEAKDEV